MYRPIKSYRTIGYLKNINFEIQNLFLVITHLLVIERRFFKCLLFSIDVVVFEVVLRRWQP